MPVPFRQIPAALLVPGQYQEVDNSLAGSVSEIKKVLMIGYKTAGSPAKEGVPIQVLSGSKASALCGHGSPLAVMAASFLEINKMEECWLLPVSELETGTPFKQDFSVEADTTAAGDVAITINGEPLFAGIGAGNTASDIAAAIVASINSKINLPVEASVNTEEPGSFTIQSLVKGINGNRNTVTIIPNASGVTVSEGNKTPGTGVTDISALFAGLSEVRYNYIVSDFDDAANIKALALELESRYSAMRQIGGRAFIALSGDIGSATENGSLLHQAEEVNSPHIVLVSRMNNVQLPGEWAARFCASACRILADDPAANTYDTQVNGLFADKTVPFDYRQKLLEAGISTWRLDSVGNVLIERLVTSYTENTDGGRDTSYLDIQVTETVDAVRTYINSLAKTRFKTWKLAGTEENFGAGSKVMTPGVWRSFLADVYQTVFIQEKQWCQNFEAYKKSILVEVKKDSKTRLEYSHQPELIGQFLIGAGLLQFK